MYFLHLMLIFSPQNDVTVNGPLKDSTTNSLTASMALFMTSWPFPSGTSSLKTSLKFLDTLVTKNHKDQHKI